MKKLTVGFISNGKSTNRYHAPFILNRRDKFTIKTIYARHPEKTDWARIEGVNYTSDLNSLLNDPEIDVVIVTTPHQFHYSYAKQVIEAGKNCVLEKPFTETKKEAEELFAGIYRIPAGTVSPYFFVPFFQIEKR